MTVTLMRLVDGPREFVLHQPSERREDVIVESIDVPSPGVRATVADRHTDGTLDSTANHGARAVSLSLVLFDTPTGTVDELNGFLHPSARPWLVVADDEWAQERRLRLRVDQFGSPMPTVSDRVRRVQMQWQAPDGVWEATAPTVFTVGAAADVPTGRTYNLTFPRSYPASQTVGSALHVNLGNTFADFTARLYGPCRGPRLTDDLTGRTIAFTDELELGPGEYVEINTRDRTALLLSDTTVSRLNLIDFAATVWWRLRPGTNQVRYSPSSAVEAGSVAVVDYYPRWL